MPNEIDSNIGKRLRRRRRLLGLTLSEAGQRIGMSYQQLQKYEIGPNRIFAARLYELSQVLEVPLAYFFKDPDSKPEEEKVAEVHLSEERVRSLLKSYHALTPEGRREMERYARSLAERSRAA